MSEQEPNAPPGFQWAFLEIDIPFCRDLILLEEKLLGRKMTNEECVLAIRKELNFAPHRAKQIVDTIKGEIIPCADNGVSKFGDRS